MKLTTDHLKEKRIGAGMMEWQAILPHVALASHMGAGSSPSCSSSDPVPSEVSDQFSSEPVYGRRLFCTSLRESVHCTQTLL